MNISISEMYCTECGKSGIEIPRKVGKEREAGHLKSLYCINFLPDMQMRRFQMCVKASNSFSY